MAHNTNINNQPEGITELITERIKIEKQIDTFSRKFYNGGRCSIIDCAKNIENEQKLKEIIELINGFDSKGGDTIEAN